MDKTVTKVKMADGRITDLDGKGKVDGSTPDYKSIEENCTNENLVYLRSTDIICGTGIEQDKIQELDDTSSFSPSPDNVVKGNTCVQKESMCDNNIISTDLEGAVGCEGEQITRTVEHDGCSKSELASALLHREDVLLFDPETDLVPLEEGLYMNKNNVFVYDIQVPREMKVIDGKLDCGRYKDGWDNSEHSTLPRSTLVVDELMEECKNVLHVCSNAVHGNNVDEMEVIRNRLMTVLDKIEGSGVFCSDSEEESDASFKEIEVNKLLDQVDAHSQVNLGHTSEPNDRPNAKEAWTDVGLNLSISDIHIVNTHVNDLPIEVLHNIFSYLSMEELCDCVAPVCRQWHDLAFDPIHWQVLDLDSRPSLLQHQLFTLIDRSPLLKTLSLQQRYQTECEALYIATHSTKLKSLNIGFSKCLDEEVLQNYVEHCTELEKLNLEGVYFPCNGGIVELICGFKKLTTLNLSHCSLDDLGLIQLSQNLPLLTDIDIDGFTCVTDNGIKELVRTHSDVLTRMILDGEELSDDSIKVLSQCTRLHTLHLSFCELLTDKALGFIKTMCNLRDLKLKKGNELSSVMLQDMFECDSLQYLHHLDLSECVNLHDGAIEKLAKCCGVLTVLELSWCWNITDTGLKAIVNHCRKLVRMILIGLKMITGQDLTLIPENLPHLIMLDLSQCNEIDDVVVREVALAMPMLTALDYYGNEILSD